MIIDVDYVGETFTYSYGGVNTVMDFATITASAIWTDHGVIGFDTDSAPSYRINLSRNAFLDNIAYQSKATRADDTNYDQDVAIYKLYRVLEGKTTTEAQAEIDNIEAQRDAVDVLKQDYKDSTETLITDYLQAVTDNATRDTFYINKAALQSRIDYVSGAIAAYVNNQGIQYWSEDPDDPVMVYVNMIAKVNDVVIAKTDAIAAAQGLYDQNAASIAAWINSPEYNTDLSLQALVTSTQAANVDLQDQIDSLNTDLTGALSTRAYREGQAKDEMDTMLADLNSQMDTMETNELSLPAYTEVGDRPEIPAMDFIGSVLMKKLYFITNDDTWPDTDLSNVVLADIADYEAENGPIVIT